MELNAQKVLTEPTTTALDEQTLGNEHPQQINRAVAFHALKDQLLALLYSERPVEEVIKSSSGFSWDRPAVSDST